MNTKRITIALLLGAMLVLAGCGEPDTGNEDSGDGLAADTGQNVSDVTIGESYYFEVKLTEKNQQNLVQRRPPFEMDDSLERQNLIQRYKYLNDENNIHHVYLMDEGQVIAYYVAQGKVSSVNSKLTNNKQVVRVAGCKFIPDNGNGGVGSEGACYKTVESPQMDGSYGTNGEAIFFFTTDGRYVESSLDYVVSEEAMNIQDERILVQTTNSTA
jgi:hypothetical protein